MGRNRVSSGPAAGSGLTGLVRELPLAVALAAIVITTVSAHHSIAAVYDSSRSVEIDAVVREFHFVNPHPYLIVTVLGDRGDAMPWYLELDNRGELAAVGMSVRTLSPGDVVVVTGSPSRTESRAMYVRKLVRPSDGFEYEQRGTSPRIRTR